MHYQSSRLSDALLLATRNLVGSVVLRTALLAVAGFVVGSAQAQATLLVTDTTNITLANSQVESGGDGSDNPLVHNPLLVGALVPYTPTAGIYNCCGANFQGNNLNDGDVGIPPQNGLAQDGLYALPDSTATLALNFGAATTVGSIAIYNGYGNRDDGTYELRDGANNLLGAWSISGTGGSQNSGVDSFWLTFNTPVTTNELRVVLNVADGGSGSFREIQVFAPVPEPATANLVAMSTATLCLTRRRRAR